MDDDGEDDAGASGSSDGMSGATEGPRDSTGEGGANSTSTQGSGSGGSMSADTSSESGTGDGPSTDELCRAYSDHFGVCFPDSSTDARSEYDYCLYVIGTGVEHSSSCAQAYEELFACLSEVQCENWPISTATEVACPAQDDAVFTDCAPQ